METIGTSMTPDILVVESPSTDTDRQSPVGSQSPVNGQSPVGSQSPLENQTMNHVFITTVDLMDNDPIETEGYVDRLSVNGDICHKSRPKSLKTISRSSNRSRKSRTDNSGSSFVRGHSSDSDSDHEEIKVTTFDHEFHAVDIHDEKAFDTDLEVEAAIKLPHIVDGVLDFQSIRLAYCEQAEVVRQKGAQDPSSMWAVLDIVDVLDIESSLQDNCKSFRKQKDLL